MKPGHGNGLGVPDHLIDQFAAKKAGQAPVAGRRVDHAPGKRLQDCLGEFGIPVGQRIDRRHEPAQATGE